VRRREFIKVFGGCALFTLPHLAIAQTATRLARVGLIIGTSPEDVESKRRRTNFERRLQGLGWTDGRNVDFAYRWVESGIERFRAAAAELVELQPDVIVVAGTQAAAAVLRKTRTIPLVFVTVADPVAQGLVASLAHPGGNATGFTNFEFSLGPKWLETLKELAPQTKRVGLLLNPTNPTIPLFLEQIRSSAVSFDVETVIAPARSRDEIESAMMKVAGPGGGLIVAGETSSDEILVERIAAGNKLAMQALFARHRTSVYRWLLRFVSNETLAEDLLSEVFLDVWRQAARP
jgi:putative tryptophan/tyrosine transport system substrate-binding protein